MRIATFNVDSLDDPPRGDVTLEQRIAVLKPQLERLRADILCLQEVNAQHRPGAAHRSLEALDRLLAGTEYAGFARAVSDGPGAGPADVHNLVTLSRWPIAAARSIRNDIVPAPLYRPLTAAPGEREPAPARFDRPTLVADIALPEGTTATVVNVHLRAPLAISIPGQKEGPFVWKSAAAWAEGFAMAAWKRTGQALEARLAIDRLLDEAPDRLIVVAGDFNAEDHETPLKILAAADDDTGNGRLAVRSLVILDRAIAADLRFSTVHHGRPQMLDHILITKPHLAQFRSIEVHNEALTDELVGFSKTGHITSSYHAPLVAELALGS